MLAVRPNPNMLSSASTASENPSEQSTSQSPGYSFPSRTSYVVYARAPRG